METILSLLVTYLISILIGSVTTIPTPSEIHHDKATQHQVAHSSNCNKPQTGNPFDILPHADKLGITHKNLTNFTTKDLFSQNQSEIAQKSEDIYDIGLFSAVCWTRIETTIEDNNNEIIDQFIEYSVSFETPGDIPDKYVESKTEKEGGVKTSVTVPIETVHKSENKIVKEKKYITCSSGPIYSRTIIQYLGNRQKLEIRVSPKTKAMTLLPEETPFGHPSNKDHLELLSELTKLGICRPQANVQNEDDWLSNCGEAEFHSDEKPESSEELTSDMKEEYLWEIIGDILNKTETEQQATVDALKETVNELIREELETLKNDTTLDEIKREIINDLVKDIAHEVTFDEIKTLQNESVPEEVKEEIANEIIESEIAKTVLDQTFETFILKVVKNDNEGLIEKCYEVYKFIAQVQCPSDNFMIPVIINSFNFPKDIYVSVQFLSNTTNKHNLLVKDSNKNICYNIFKSETVQCPYESSYLPTVRVPEIIKINPEEVKITDELMNKIVEEKSPTSVLGNTFGTFPMIVNDLENGKPSQHCFEFYKVIIQTPCPTKQEELPIVESLQLPLNVEFTYSPHIFDMSNKFVIFAKSPELEACFVFLKHHEIECLTITNQVPQIEDEPQLAQEVLENLLNIAKPDLVKTEQTKTEDKVPELIKNENDAFVMNIPNKEISNKIPKIEEQLQELNINKPNITKPKTDIKIELKKPLENFTIKIVNYDGNIPNHVCFEIYKLVAEVSCPLDVTLVPTMLPGSNFPADIQIQLGQSSENIYNFLIRNAQNSLCYNVLKIRKVKCPKNEKNLLIVMLPLLNKIKNNKIPTPIREEQNKASTVSALFEEPNPSVTPAEIEQYISEEVIPDLSTIAKPSTVLKEHLKKPLETFILRVIDKENNHICYETHKLIAKVDCPSEVKTIPTMLLNSSFPADVQIEVGYPSVKYNFLIRNTEKEICFNVLKIKKVICPKTENILLTVVPGPVSTIPNNKISTAINKDQEKLILLGVPEQETHTAQDIISDLPDTDKPEFGSEKLKKPLMSPTVEIPISTQSEEVSKITSKEILVSTSKDKNKLLVNKTPEKETVIQVPQKKEHKPQENNEVIHNIIENKIPIFASKDTNKAPKEKLKVNKMPIPISGNLNETFVIPVLNNESNTKVCYEVYKVIAQIYCPITTKNVPLINISTFPSDIILIFTQRILTPTKQNELLAKSVESDYCYIMLVKNKVDCIKDKIEDNLPAKVANEEKPKINLSKSVGTFVMGLTKNNVKEHCFEVYKMLTQVNCPADISEIPEITNPTLPSDVQIKFSFLSDTTYKYNYVVRDSKKNICYNILKINKVDCLNKILDSSIVNSGEMEFGEPTTPIVIFDAIKDIVKPTSTEKLIPNDETFILKITDNLVETCYEFYKLVVPIECPMQWKHLPKCDASKFPSDIKISSHQSSQLRNYEIMVQSDETASCYVLFKRVEVKCPIYFQQIPDKEIVTPNLLELQISNETFVSKVTDNLIETCYEFYKLAIPTQCPSQWTQLPKFDATKFPTDIKIIAHQNLQLKNYELLIRSDETASCYVVYKHREVKCPSDFQQIPSNKIADTSTSMQVREISTKRPSSNPTKEIVLQKDHMKQLIGLLCPTKFRGYRKILLN